MQLHFLFSEGVTMDDVFKRVVEAAKNRGKIGNSAIANLLNESPQVISNWSKRGVPSAKVGYIAEILNVSSDWLLTGKSPNTSAPLRPGLSRQEEVLIELFRGLTEGQQQATIKSIEGQKRDNDEIWEQLSKVMGKK